MRLAVVNPTPGRRFAIISALAVFIFKRVSSAGTTRSGIASSFSTSKSGRAIFDKRPFSAEYGTSCSRVT